MPHVKPKSLHPQHGVGYHGAFLGTADEDLAENDVVIATGVDGDRIKFSKADSNAANLRLGLMGIADHAADDGNKIRVVTHKVITTSINTSGSTLGAPVYLGETPGAHVIAAPTNDICIGNVLTLAASGAKVVLAPSSCNGAVTGQAYTA